MAGGKGTRFWPLSRAKKAKQFLRIIGNKTLLEHTISRIRPLVGDRLWVVGNQGQSRYLNPATKTLPKSQVLKEPFGNNTAPSIALAAIRLLRDDPEAIMAVLPSDHMIDSAPNFRKTLRAAFAHVEKHAVFVTIGIPPTSPHTGYGYIEAKTTDTVFSPVLRFCEKPDLDTAKRFLSQGSFYWNAGIFVWRADQILSTIMDHMPGMQAGITHLQHNHKWTQQILTDAYTQMPNLSIDYGVMEKSAHITHVTPAAFGWDDIGNWTAMDTYWPHDDAHNAYRASLIVQNSHRNIVYSHKPVALIDTNDLIVVDTEDVLFIAPKSSDQKIRDLYVKLPKALL